MRKYIIALLLLFIPSIAFGATASFVTQNSITWTFDTNYTVGQFANGDYYVVDPGSGVTINTISPASTSGDPRGMNGSMINPTHPSNNQGYDEQITWSGSGVAPPYIEGLNVALDVDAGSPLVLNSGESLVSVKSQASGWQLPQFTNMAILTCLSSEPSSGSFRPGYMGAGKTIPHNISDINWAAMGAITPLSGAPSFSTFETATEFVWYEGIVHWIGRYFRATVNVPIANYGYGSDMAKYLGQALLLLNCNYSQSTKETLLYQILQYAIDISSCMSNGMSWPANGGHGHGRKTVLAFGGKVFNDSTMLAQINYATYQSFAEDLHIWEISQADYDRTVTGHTSEVGPVTQYSSGITPIGTAEWGWDHISSPTSDNAARTAVYRSSWGANIAGMLVTRITNAQTTWNRDLSFSYAERFRVLMDEGTVGQWGTYTPSTWVKNMYDDYWDSCADGACLGSGEGSVAIGGSQTITTGGSQALTVRK